jgi:glutamyl-tRNA synthetase
LYPAYETQGELDRRRKLQQARGLPPIYDRAALKLTQEERAALEAEGRKPHWRFKLEHKTIAWRDLIRGDSHIDCASLSDPVLVREDGTFLYTLPSVVDDVDMGVTHIIRGEDHVTNTAVQIQIFEALAGKAPAFAHHNLLVDATGAGLSKRTGSLSLSSLREAGVEPLAVAAIAVLTGSSDEVRAVASLDELAALFDLAHISKNAAKFDPAELNALTARTLHLLSFESVRARLREAGVPDDDAFWRAVRGNLERFEDVKIWADVVYGAVAPVIENAEFCASAANLLPQEPWDETTWSQWTAAVKTATGAKGKALFHPLRLALTGRENGPELAKLLPLLGRPKCVARLRGETA